MLLLAELVLSAPKFFKGSFGCVAVAGFACGYGGEVGAVIFRAVDAEGGDGG